MWISPLAGALVVGTAAWLSDGGSHGPGGLGGAVPLALAVGCGLGFAASGLLVRAARDGVAFGLSALGIVAAAAAAFTALFPRVMVSSGPASLRANLRVGAPHATDGQITDLLRELRLGPSVVPSLPAASMPCSTSNTPNVSWAASRSW
jgi:hypothetical protein